MHFWNHDPVGDVALLKFICRLFFLSHKTIFALTVWTSIVIRSHSAGQNLHSCLDKDGGFASQFVAAFIHRLSSVLMHNDSLKNAACPP